MGKRWEKLKRSVAKRTKRFKAFRDRWQLKGQDWLEKALTEPNTDGNDGIEKFAFQGTDVAADLVAKYGPQGPLTDIYTTTTGTLVHKWHHYLPLYERYFEPWRRPAKAPLRFLEIGVYRGGSLTMWRRFFGPDAIIFGIDIDTHCARYNGIDGQVRIGSQADPEFLRKVVAEMGGVDVILDDGSHMVEHVKASFQTLFPLLAVGGIYAIEDLHTSYWPIYGGGHPKRTNIFDDLRNWTDDMHHWYHSKPLSAPALKDQIAGIHIHDSIAFIDKAQVHRPTHSRVGQWPDGEKGPG